METFKEEVFSDESSILNELPEAKLVVRVFFKVLPDNLRISIINNIAILEEELVKVESRVKRPTRTRISRTPSTTFSTIRRERVSGSPWR